MNTKEPTYRWEVCSTYLYGDDDDYELDGWEPFSTDGDTIYWRRRTLVAEENGVEEVCMDDNSKSGLPRNTPDFHTKENVRCVLFGKAFALLAGAHLALASSPSCQAATEQLQDAKRKIKELLRTLDGIGVEE